MRYYYTVYLLGSKEGGVTKCNIGGGAQPPLLAPGFCVFIKIPSTYSALYNQPV